jgi:arylsulfatase A-like enzyme
MTTPSTFPRRARRLGALLLGSLLLIACRGEDDRGKGEPGARRVILITCDTLRADRLGVYGYERDVSPHLDAFAREAIVFDTAYSTAPLTLPSVCSLLTGRLPEEIGVEHNRQILLPPANTLAEELSAAGIPTSAVVSNWVLKTPPGVPREYGVQQGFDHFDDQMTTREAVRGMPERIAPLTTKAAIEALKRQRATGEDRFFLWVHYQDPHGPYAAPPRHQEAMDRPATDEVPLPLGTSTSGHGVLPSYQERGERRHPEYYRIQYDAEIRYFDEWVGRLLQWLEEHDWIDDSLVIISADHGESLGEHDYWFCHGESLFDELVRVPLIIRYPAGLPHPTAPLQGDYRRASEVVSQIDIFPTVLEVFGLQVPPASGSGHSLLSSASRADALAIQMVGLDDGARKVRAVRDSRYHLIFEEGVNPMLFDLAKDPGQERDLGNVEPEVVDRLRERYRQIIERAAEQERITGTDREFSEEDRRIMEALGYAGGEQDPEQDGTDGSD